MKCSLYITINDVINNCFGFINRNKFELLKWLLLLLPIPLVLGIIAGYKETAAEEYCNFLLKVSSGQKKALFRAIFTAMLYLLILVPYSIPSLKPFAKYVSLGLIALYAFITGVQFGAIIVENKLSGYLLFLLILIPVCLILSFISLCFCLYNDKRLLCCDNALCGIVWFVGLTLFISILFYCVILTFLAMFFKP